MKRPLTPPEIANIQRKYSYLTNYQAEDITAPIEPLTYIDSNGDGLLHIATVANDIQTVELLLAAGVDVDQRGDMGCTALHYARQKQFKDIEVFLLENGATRNIENDFGEKCID